ncbi:hypothetical protein EU805_10695 [Salipiger sp. IMCC34102]|uniref:hypothetical protein n=1 Tax=Salipiger sp. IMCC34102 TaxID=2510647 RepID=UPI00101C3152|nr:hypothetical protein [Salipiger sp. IMCC34102]RYH02309.1 hypothetical protein EU805_10695 [Salipiger sp. IMCC34102]
MNDRRSTKTDYGTYLWPVGLCLAGISAVLAGSWGVLSYCGATFISVSPYCSEGVESAFVVVILAGVVIAPTSLFVLIWRLFRSLRRK